LWWRAQEGEGLSEHVTCRDKNGKTLELNLSTWPVHDADGRVAATIGIYADIHAEELRLRHSLAEKQLEEVERLYATAPIGLGFLDTELRFVRVNAMLARMNGLSLEGHIGERLADIVPEVAASMEVILREVIATGVPLTDHELRAATPALPGVRRDWQVSAYPLKHPDGTVLGITVAVSDISERKRLSDELKRQERALRDSEERFRRIVETAVEGIWIVDATGLTSFVNNRMASILGYTREEMIGRLCFDFFDIEERERARRLDFQLQKFVTAEQQEFRLRHKNGSTVWLDITGTSMIDDAGTFTGLLKICSDVTLRKMHEQRLRQLQKLESLGILAGGVAHDFNNLLTAVMGNASLVMQTLEPESRSKAMLQSIITASEQAAQLTRQLLIYAGKGQGELQPMDIGTIAEDLVRLLSASIPKTVQLSLKLEESVPLVEANPAHLQHMMMNLVINAVESIPENGAGQVKVAVGRHTLQPEDYRDAVVPLEAGGTEYVSFSVTDNGGGMDAATQSRIFDPFFSTKFQGRGLGLATVLGIVKGYGGTVTVRSTLGQGSGFTVLLPASRVARGVEFPVAPAPRAATAGAGAILFVDDEAALRAIAQQVLEAHGYRVLLAANGRQAIAELEAHPEVRAVVLDLTMPMMGGDNAAPILHSLRPDVPLILSSGYLESYAVERVGPGVVAAFLDKPYQPGALVAKLEEVLRRRPNS
jgi:PAS domain S-box-containing protein